MQIRTMRRVRVMAASIGQATADVKASARKRAMLAAA